MRTHYYNRATKYNTKYNQAKRDLVKNVKNIIITTTVVLTGYAFIYIMLVAGGAQY